MDSSGDGQGCEQRASAVTQASRSKNYSSKTPWVSVVLLLNHPHWCWRLSL